MVGGTGVRTAFFDNSALSLTSLTPDSACTSTGGKAERIIREELNALGWNDGDLRGHRKSDASKVRIAARLRRETTMTLDWIAEHLSMGSAGHVSHLFYRNKSNREKAGGEESQKKLF